MTKTLTAALILSQNGYTTSDFATADVEAMIDDASDYINLLCGTSIADVAAGEVTVEDEENVALKLLLTIMLREAKKTSLSNSSSTGSGTGGSNSVSAGGLSASESSSVSSSISAASALNNNTNSPLIEFLNQALERLRALHPTTQTSTFRLRFGVGQASS